MMRFLFLLLLASGSLLAQIKPLVGTYLGDNERNFYGNRAPSKLRVKWKTWLGTGKTTFGLDDVRTWKGAGWTGQPLVIPALSGFGLLMLILLIAGVGGFATRFRPM